MSYNQYILRKPQLYLIRIFAPMLERRKKKMTDEEFAKYRSKKILIEGGLVALFIISYLMLFMWAKSVPVS